MLPPLVFAMVIVAIFGASYVTVILAIGVTTWTDLARLTRAEVLKIKEREFVMAARAIGMRNRPLIVGVCCRMRCRRWSSRSPFRSGSPSSTRPP